MYLNKSQYSLIFLHCTSFSERIIFLKLKTKFIHFFMCKIYHKKSLIKKRSSSKPYMFYIMLLDIFCLFKIEQQFELKKRKNAYKKPKNANKVLLVYSSIKRRIIVFYFNVRNFVFILNAIILKEFLIYFLSQ